MSYKSEFQANNVDLQGLIDVVKNLPVERTDALFISEKIEGSELKTVIVDINNNDVTEEIIEAVTDVSVTDDGNGNVFVTMEGFGNIFEIE